MFHALLGVNYVFVIHLLLLFVCVHVLIIAHSHQTVNQNGVVFLQLYCSTEHDFLPGKGLYFPGLVKVRMVPLVEPALPHGALGCGLQMPLGKLRHVSQLVCQCDSQCDPVASGFEHHKECIYARQWNGGAHLC